MVGPSRCRPTGRRKAEQKGLSSESAAFNLAGSSTELSLPYRHPELSHTTTSNFKEGWSILSLFFLGSHVLS